MDSLTDAQDRADTLEKLEIKAQLNVEPTLSGAEVEDILDNNKRGLRWITGLVVVVGDVLLPTVRNGHRYPVTEGGTLGATEPTWPTTEGSSVTDGLVEMEEGGPDYASAYDLRGAIRECWELKAAKASEYISSQDSGSEQMIFEHCVKMVDSYSNHPNSRRCLTRQRT